MRVRPFRPEVATQILRQQIKGLPGTVGIVVTDLISGQTASVNPMATFHGASTLKVPIAMAVLQLVDQGRLSLQQPIRYQESDFERGTGTLQATIKPGDQLTVERLLDLMITVSDNIARNMLERFIGSGTIREYMLSLGVSPPYDPVERTVTPHGMNQVLLALDSGRSGLSRESTLRLLHWMEQTVHRNRIPRFLPSEVVVANKIGTVPNQVHDIGLVYAPDRSFAISVFTRGIPEEQAEEAIGRIAAAIYWYEDSLAAPDQQ
ncbi:MAG TPA: serine hydrolase [Symbiobacteriaceae bacterium]